MIYEDLLVKIAKTISGGIDVLSDDPVKQFVNDSLERLLAAPRRISKRFAVSSFYDMCDVREAFARMNGTWGRVAPSTPAQTRDALALSLMAAAGNQAHDWFQKNVFAHNDSLWGNWRCTTCDKVFEFQFESEAREKHEDAHDDFFLVSEEIKLIFAPDDLPPEYHVSGRVDGVLFIDGMWYIIELKTCSNSVFTGIDAKIDAKTGAYVASPSFAELPKEPHLFQTRIYQSILYHLVETEQVFLSWESFGGSRLVYINRDNYDTKYFTVPWDYDELNNVSNYMNSRRHSVARLVAQKDPLAGTKVCTSRSSRQAKECPFKDLCFPLKRGKPVA